MRTLQPISYALPWITLLLIAGLVIFFIVYRLDNFSFNIAAYSYATISKSLSIFADRFRIDSWHFWLPLLAILLVQRLIPAIRSYKTLSVGFFHDLVWFLITPFLLVSMVYSSKHLLNEGFSTYLSFLAVDVFREWPVSLQVITVILASDFLHWFAHLLKHKVKLFWYFHSVHHSQRELNVFTDLRVHPVEVIITYGIRFLPLLALKLEIAVPLGITWWLFSHWHTAAYHANIRSNYGILRYILVTPQSHRVHHSREESHQDRNFGVFFSIWDHMFGTQYRGYDEYPDTGISDQDFPLEKRATIRSLLVTPLRQLLYPFLLIIRREQPVQHPASTRQHHSAVP